jgi:hypothetical protein
LKKRVFLRTSFLEKQEFLAENKSFFTNSWALGLPLQKLMNTSFMQEMSQGAIGVTNPSYMTAGLATCPPLGILLHDCRSLRPARLWGSCAAQKQLTVTLYRKNKKNFVDIDFGFTNLERKLLYTIKKGAVMPLLFLILFGYYLF